MTVPTHRRDGARRDGADLSSWALAAPLPLRPGGPLAAVLATLAYRVGFLPDDAQAGPYTRITVVQSATVMVPRSAATAYTVVSAQTRWRNEQANSGQISATSWHRATAAAPPRVTVHYRSLGLPGILPGPIPTGHEALASVLSRSLRLPSADLPITRMREALRRLGAGPPPGAAAGVRAVGDLVRWHGTPPAVRASTLRVLARVPNLLTHGPVALAGHTALAVSLTHGPTRDVLLIDTGTGEIRGAEHVLLDPGIGHLLGVPVPYCLARARFSDHSRSPYPGDLTNAPAGVPLRPWHDRHD